MVKPYIQASMYHVSINSNTMVIACIRRIVVNAYPRKHIIKKLNNKIHFNPISAIPLFGVMTKIDRVGKTIKYEVFEERKNKFIEQLGLKGATHRFACISNYCDDVDPQKKRLTGVIPTLDEPILQFMTQVCDPAIKVVTLRHFCYVFQPSLSDPGGSIEHILAKKLEPGHILILGQVITNRTYQSYVNFRKFPNKGAVRPDREEVRP